MNTPEKSDITNERYTRGWAKLKEIDGQAGERVIAALADIAREEL